MPVAAAPKPAAAPTPSPAAARVAPPPLPPSGVASPPAPRVVPPPLPPTNEADTPKVPKVGPLADDDPTVVARSPFAPQVGKPDGVAAATPARARAPAAAPVPAPAPPKADEESRIQTAVEAAVRPLRNSMLDMQRQLEEAQRIIREREQAAATQPAATQPAATQPAATQPAATQPAATQPAATQPAPTPLAPEASQAAQPLATVAPLPPVRARMPSLLAVPAADAPLLDLKAIEQDTSIATDDAFDGRRRKRRILVVFAVFLLAAFGALFALLAQSYAHRG